jgi:hypothetical protein
VSPGVAAVLSVLADRLDTESVQPQEREGFLS